MKIKEECDYIKFHENSMFAYCNRDSSFGIYAFVDRKCHESCYINKQEERKLKLNNINKI